MASRVPGVKRASEGEKPRILAVDDHRGVLDKVTAVLTPEFDIVGVASDGREAIAIADQLAPDAIVLDINMPGLDGYQTKSALDQAGSRAPVVFLSMLDSEEYVSEAFQRGGRGYVLKPYVVRDLARALHHVLLGRRFVPSLASLLQLTNGGGHGMQLYRDPEVFLDALGGFFDLALRRGDATCVIATRELREGLSDRLRARGWDVDGPSHHTRYLVVDAADALDRFMRNGLPDHACLAEIAAELDQYRLAVTERAASQLTIFGNMVGVLNAAGNTNAVTALEGAWNSLTHDLPFFTLCGYSTSCFHDMPGPWSEACAEHSTVGHAIDL